MCVHDFEMLLYHVSRNARIEPFRIAISKHEIDRLHLLLDHCPLADANWENTREHGRFGVSRDCLVAAVQEWRYNHDCLVWPFGPWSTLTRLRSKREAQFNSFPQYMITLDDDDGRPYSIRFNALFSAHSNALPTIFLHGWPGSAVEFLPMLELIQKQYPAAEAFPYHILVPDLIGFGFSSPPPTDKDFTYDDNARILLKMMHSLGFTAQNGGYVTQGGEQKACLGVAR